MIQVAIALAASAIVLVLTFFVATAMYTTISGADIWQTYTKENAPHGLFRGGGNESSPKMYKEENGHGTVRGADFKIFYDKALGKDMVYPDRSKGLSFSNSLQRLQKIPIKGKVWRLPREHQLPEGFVINYGSIDHPLINVGIIMSVDDLILKLKELEKLMEYTGVKIL